MPIDWRENPHCLQVNCAWRRHSLWSHQINWFTWVKFVRVSKQEDQEVEIKCLIVWAHWFPRLRWSSKSGKADDRVEK